MSGQTVNNSIRIETLRQEVDWMKQQNKAIWDILKTISTDLDDIVSILGRD